MISTTQTTDTKQLATNNNNQTKFCSRCNETFRANETMACTGQDQFWHMACFVCSQCLRPFGQKHEYFGVQGRLYCERDFKTLFAPCCGKCNHSIIGRYIRALNKCWHPNCFLCQACQLPLADLGFLKGTNNEALCHGCHTMEKQATKRLVKCFKCNKFIGDQDEPDDKPLYIKSEPYHAYHFNCQRCGIELDSQSKSVDGDGLYCLKCHDRFLVDICGACRKPIEERAVAALGRHWHIEHFACCICDKPFRGKKHYENQGKAYCEEHYFEQFGHKCQNCAIIIRDDLVVCALDKYYCQNHFACYYCQAGLIVNKSQFFDVASNPCCKKCFRKMPVSIRKQSKAKISPKET